MHRFKVELANSPLVTQAGLPAVPLDTVMRVVLGLVLIEGRGSSRRSLGPAGRIVRNAPWLGGRPEAVGPVGDRPLGMRLMGVRVEGWSAPRVSRDVAVRRAVFGTALPLGGLILTLAMPVVRRSAFGCAGGVVRWLVW
ncbi:hypothetical protein ADK86_12415 [Streptomyces sp. NRRL F-5755]|nr:hypothetical protein ADK86_12415 [Streptomyces sp. NRRL F-5755]